MRHQQSRPSYQTSSDEFVQNYQPEEQNKKCCKPVSAALVLRFILRSTVPLILGLGSGMLVEWGERKAGMHSNFTLVELSDFTSCAMTLIVAYTLDALLKKCWPITPYSEQENYFQTENNDSIFLNRTL